MDGPCIADQKNRPSGPKTRGDLELAEIKFEQPFRQILQRIPNLSRPNFNFPGHSHLSDPQSGVPPPQNRSNPQEQISSISR
jgi:hypothetical protein